jgi:ankyrin repeat protein
VALTFAHLSDLAGVSEASLPSLGQELPKNLVKGMDEIERNLLRQGAREGWNEAELVLAARANEWEYIEKIIVDGVRIDIQDSQGRTAVHFAAANGAQDSLEALLGENAAVDERDHNGRTPLMEAARGGHLDVVKYLLMKQINIGNRDSHKDTALIEAAREGFVQILEALFEKSPNLLAWKMISTPH